MTNKSGLFNRIILGSNYKLEGINTKIMDSSEDAKIIADKIADEIVKKLKLKFDLSAKKE